MYKLVLAVATIAVISAAPAQARHVKHHQGHFAQYGATGPMAYPGEYAHYGRDPYGVYVGNQEVGRDPDPNVRQRLLSDYDYLYRW